MLNISEFRTISSKTFFFHLHFLHFWLPNKSSSILTATSLEWLLMVFLRIPRIGLQAYLITSFDGQYIIFGSGARASSASLPQCSMFPFSFHSCGPFLYFGSNAASLKWFFSRRCFSWFSLDSKNSDRTPIWKVRMVRSLADRTFQLSLRRRNDGSTTDR